MKKLIIAAMALTCATAIVSADTVTSENIVGYVKLQNSAGFRVLGTPFVATTNTPAGVFGDTLPVGSKVYIYDTNYQIAEYIEDFLGAKSWDNDFNIGAPVGYWLSVPSAVTNIVSGNVELADSVTNSIVVGLQLLSYPYPVERTVEQLGFTPSVGDKIYKYGTTYQIAEYVEDFLGVKSWDNNFIIGVEEGFWYEAVGAQDWIVSRPFTP